MNVIVRQTCRLCGSSSLTSIVDLGSQMLACAFISKENEHNVPTRKVPIELVRCNPQLDENACGLVQLRHTVPGDAMYTDYWYASAVNQTMRDALKDVVDRAQEFVTVEKGDVALDIGCNDGTLLKAYGNPDLELVGFDPARNFLGITGEGFLRITDFFNERSYRKAMGDKKAKIITSIAMFYDLEDPTGFTKEVERVLHDDGIWVVQLADLPNMLRKRMFDSVYHEHIEYYHLAPFEHLLRKCGLKLVDIAMNSINGSSYRLYIRKIGAKDASMEALDRILAKRMEEYNMALDTDEPYIAFRDSIEGIRSDLLAVIDKANKEGKKVFVYGASSKGNVLLQYCGITPEMVPYAADRNPRKYGTKTLGTNIPIISEEDARAMKPDYFLVLPYHFMEEMLPREKAFTDAGGKFIVPVPKVSLVP